MNQDKNSKKNKNQTSLTKELYNYFVEWSLNSTTHGIPMVLPIFSSIIIKLFSSNYFYYFLNKR